MNTLKISNLYKSFNGNELFGGLSFEVNSGRIIAITGANGSGKSTLLKIAARLLVPDKGEAVFLKDEIPVSANEYRNHFAMSAPSLSLYENMTFFENLKFFLELRGQSLTGDYGSSLSKRVGLPEKIESRFIKQFSTGMKQRAKLAVMIAVGADVWLLDEPGANLDEEGRGMMAREIRRAADEKRIVVIATNTADEEGIADAVVRI